MPLQMPLLLLPDEEKTDVELIAELALYGWRKTNYWPESGVYQFSKPGLIFNMRRSGMINQIEKERLLAAGDFEGYLRYPPPSGYYKY